MKKILISALCLLLLAGCSGDKTASVSSGDEAVVTIGSAKITKSTLYNMMINSTGLNSIMLKVQNTILDKEVPIDEELETEAKEALSSYQLMYGDYFTSMINYYGFKDEDDFYENALLLNARLSRLSENYVEMNFDSMNETYAPKKINVLTFSGIEDASDAHAAIEKGMTLEEAAEAYNATSSSFDKVVTSSNTYFDSNVISFVKGSDEPSISSAILHSTGESCFIIEVISTDPSEYHDEAVEAICSDVSSISTESLAYYLDKYDFTIYDKTIYDSFQTSLPDYLVQSK